MFSRLSRARLPLARCIHSRATPPPSRAAKYALAVGTFATVAFFGTQTIALDSRPPPRDSSSSLPPHLAGKSPEEFPSFESHLLTSLGRAQIPPESTPEHTDAPSTRSEPVSAPADASDASSDSDASESEYSGGGGAYNPETGEINWDCPCLGGMANGPCGPQFREAFSCFVYSEEEPKGINCVEKFQAMQTCFRDHPEVYAAEIADDEEAEAAERAAREAAQPDQKTADVAESAPAESSSPKDASSEQ